MVFRGKNTHLWGENLVEQYPFRVEKTKKCVIFNASNNANI
jgi:hypothetical protein